MKRILSIFTSLSLLTVLPASLVSCTGFNISGGSDNKPIPPTPLVKDIKYYQNLLKTSEGVINDFTENMKELAKYKNDKDLFPTIADYNRTMDELTAEMNSYQAICEECQYQILYLTYNGNFTEQQKLDAIKYLTNELNFLTNEITTKQKYSTDYSPTELNDIQTQMNLVTTELNKYK
ncbi:hypothetical protein [Spiroplasma sp. DGKH1]|uniref:hypothetical protein n=1 Tax=Spiroplasma sp. DGKH1 TaxID=3050074 RepID=UPI0034C63242